MALGGGTFTTMNKILPGTYINFVSAPRASAALSDRGIAAMPAEFDWGPEGAVFAVESGEFEKRSLELFGYPYTHEKLKGLRDLFRNIRKGYFYRLNTGGERAKNDFATALQPGTRGNSLRIVIEAAEASTEETPVYDVSTWMDDTRIDLQTVKTAAQLHDNAFVRFQAEATLAATAGANLTGGTDGTAGDAAYQTFLDQIEPYTFHALGCLSDKPAVKALFTAFTKRMRDESGVKFQTVLHRYGQADYEGVISVENGLTGAADDTSAVWWTTGAQAGCAVNKSLTNRVYDGEFEIDTRYTQAQLEEGIQSGGFLLHRVGDETRVLTDINTFVSATEERSSDFGSNQTIRVLDQIGNDIAALFNTKYNGQVPNDAAGRVSLWNDIVRHHQQLQILRAIQTFEPENVTVEAGDTKKAVVVTDRVTPVNAMEQLYMVCVVA